MHPAWTRLARLLVVLAIGASLAPGATPSGATSRPSKAAEPPVGVTAPDPQLTRDLKTVMSLSPADTCLTVVIDGVTMFDHRPDDLQTPASTQKLSTAAAALDLLGPDKTYDTTAVTAGTMSGRTLRGDVVLVGAGDPGLVTSFDQAVRKAPKTLPVTLLDPLADQLRSLGITRIEGRVLGDGSRYDSQYTVPSWPSRYAAQGQAGPISALAVDDGYLLQPDDDGKLDRVRSQAPAADAALAFASVLKAKGIEITGGTGAGTQAAGSRELGHVTSPRLEAIVSDLLHRSDNQAAELVAKELGVVKGAGGTTAAGTRVIADWVASHQAAAKGSYIVDGSGLDHGNKTSCRELTKVLDAAGGRTGTLAQGLSVAGESGTLGARFRNSAAVGKLRGKTGSLTGVTSLAGFVDLPDGGSATFAYIANGEPVTGQVLRAQDFLAQLLATYRPACPNALGPDVVAPVLLQVAQLGTLTAGASAMAMPGVVATFDAAEANADALLDRCSAEDDSIHVVVAPR